jgi:hypothetical protein
MLKELAVSKAKKPIRVNGREKAEASGAPAWRSHLDHYRELERLVFENDEELDRAIDLLWTDALRDLPHDSPDGRSIVIPKEAVEYFARAGLKFSAEKQLSISDLTSDQIAALRGAK